MAASRVAVTRVLVAVALVASLSSTTVGSASAQASRSVPADPSPSPRGVVGPATSEDPCNSVPVGGFGFDRYGGWKGLSRPATGRFTVAQVDGRWWFFTPDGNAFFANGPTGIRPTGGGATADGTNDYLDGIIATYGTLDAWADATFQRTCDLGIRTLGGWNSTENVDLFAGRLAYTVNIDVYSSLPAVTTGPPGLKPRRDVFAPDALTRARSTAADPLVQRCATDPWCIGVFVENEQPYAPSVTVGGSHLDVYLSEAAGSPGKVELQNFLSERHGGDIASFNSTWGTSLSSFEEIQDLNSLGTCPTGIGADDDLCTFGEPADRFADRAAFEAHVAGTVASLADRVLDEVEPAMLDLGPRLVMDPQLPQVLAALAAPADVVSVNDYDLGVVIPQLDAMIPDELGALSYDPFTRLDQIAAITGKPIYVSEWFYRLPRPDRPSVPFFLPEVPDGPAQAAAVTRYLDHLHSNPNVVGEAWFQWVDQPAEGRASDGENQLHGLVDITDTIRQPLFDTMAAIDHDVIGRRLGWPAGTTFTAHLSESECSILGSLAASNGVSMQDAVRFSVLLLDHVATTSAGPLPALPTDGGTCDVVVEWTDQDRAMLGRASRSWGVDVDGLHTGSVRVLLAILYWMSVNG
ncbi:MAG: hypothetical protein KDB02_00680 [Acidimicrobiales bacterium]|nr:hypothetical protein [Acidimicrobiales bacterium]